MGYSDPERLHGTVQPANERAVSAKSFEQRLEAMYMRIHKAGKGDHSLRIDAFFCLAADISCLFFKKGYFSVLDADDSILNDRSIDVHREYSCIFNKKIIHFHLLPR